MSAAEPGEMAHTSVPTGELLGVLAPGEAMVLDYAIGCSWAACGVQPAGTVIVANIMLAENIGRPGYFHGRWYCTEGRNHWATSAARQRLLATGSATP